MPRRTAGHGGPELEGSVGGGGGGAAPPIGSPPEYAAAFPGATGAACADARAFSAQPGTGPGHDTYLGARGGEGHLQSVGGRHRPAAARTGSGAGQGAGRLGRGAGLCPVPGGQSQGHREDRLG